MIRGIHHVGIHCHDIARMIAFYTEALGFEMVGEFDWANEDKLDYIVDLEGSVAKGAMMKSGTCYIELFQYAQPAPRNTEALSLPAAKLVRKTFAGFGEQSHFLHHRERTFFRRCPRDFFGHEKRIGDDLPRFFARI